MWGIVQPKYTCFVDEYKSKILDIPLDSRIDDVDMQRIDQDNDIQFKDSVLLMPWCSGLWSLNEFLE